MPNLRYVGNGAYRPGIPPRDIDAAEALIYPPADLAAAVAAGLYVASPEPEPEPEATVEQTEPETPVVMVTPPVPARPARRRARR